jgi:hypothetical protein
MQSPSLSRQGARSDCQASSYFNDASSRRGFPLSSRSTSVSVPVTTSRARPTGGQHSAEGEAHWGNHDEYQRVVSEARHMKTKWPREKFGEFLCPNSRPHTLGADEDANLVGMRLYGAGPFHRELKPALQIAKKSHFVIRVGVSRLTVGEMTSSLCQLTVETSPLHQQSSLGI